MRLLSVELKGFKRLALNSIDYIKITPENKIQLILGTNGSGKSSLMKELSPLPANHQEFHKEGFKIVELVHNNCHYVLKSLFPVGGNKFCFIKDGEELNPGGTMTVYRELVKKEFNLTPDTMELMLGLIRFHAMSTAERRNWFTRLSDADYTYAIQYFQKLKELHRDVIGGIKTNQARLVQESEKLLKPEQEEVYRNEIKIFSDMLTHLLELKTPIYETRDEVMRQLDEQERKLSSYAESVVKYRAQFLNMENYASIAEIDEKIIEARTRVDTAAALITQLCERIDQQQQTLHALKESNIESTADIDKTLSELVEEIDRLSRQIEYRLPITDAKEAFNAISSVAEHLHQVATQIEVNSDRRYTRDAFVTAVDRHKLLTAHVGNQEKKLQEYSARKKELEHLKTHSQLMCPKCNHTWYNGYDEKAYTVVLQTIQMTTEEIVRLNAEVITLNEYIEKAKAYLELYRVYVSITKSWTILSPLWDHINALGVIFDNPKQILTIIDTFKIDLQVMIKLEEVQKRYKDTQDLKALLSKNQQTDLSNIQDQTEKLNQELYRLNTERQEHQTTVSRLNTYRTAAIQVTQLGVEIERLMDERDVKAQKLIQLHRRDFLNKTIEQVRIELNQREQMISRIDIQKALVANIEAQIAELTEKAEILKLAVTELSPSQGLIAKGLTGFINHFVSHVNAFIKKIWLYPLEIIPIAPDEDDGVDLDYKFEFKVNDDTVIPDISKGSTGMKEVIDLAFKIVSMHYLHLQEFPIYLDELAASFDKSHREAAYRMIHDLMINSNYSQIFIISHFADSYGSFNNSDIITLCEANIASARNNAFNRNVIIA